MRVIVSSNLTHRYERYVVVPSITEVLRLTDVECVVLHTPTEDEVILASVIAEIRKKFNCTFFYVSAQPKAVLTLMISGIGGVIIEDDFYYEDESDLDALLDSYSTSVSTLTVSPVSDALAVVKDFVSSYARGEERCSKPYFIHQTNDAITELEAWVNRQEIERREMGSSAIDVFRRASGFITKLEEKNREISQQLDNLVQAPSQRRSFGVGGVSFFPTVKYNPPPTKKVLVIREFSPCKYLTSFILSYQSYLKTMKNKRVKVIFTVQKGKLIYQKYASDMFTFIAQESIDNLALYDKDLIVTNTPQSTIMQRILDKGTYDIFIIVDRLYGADVILNGNNVKQLAAVSGVSDLTRFKLSPRFCIFSHTGVQDAFFTIPTITKYARPTAPDMRASQYVQLCTKSEHKLYEKMDNFLEVDTR